MNNKKLRNIIKIDFKIGCTSYVYPADIVYNAERLAPIFDDIELVLFESDDVCNYPTKREISNLLKIKKRFNCSYTIHFPIDKKAGSCDESDRNLFTNNIKKIVNLTKSLNPYAFILHLEGITKNSSLKEIKQWKRNINEVLSKILSFKKVQTNKICIENLDYPIQLNEYFVDLNNFCYCIDIGHLWNMEENYNIEKILKKYLSKIKVIHLHGVCNGSDHISLKKNELSKVEELIKVLKSIKYNNLITFEVFNKKDTFESIELFLSLWGK